MALELWTRTSGTWINVIAILMGTSLGLLLRGRLPLRMQKIITQGVGLLTLFVGVSMAASLTQARAGAFDGVVLGLLAMVIGGLLGEWWQLEERLTDLGNWLKARFRGGGGFTEGFVAASLLFCVGPMALVGSVSNGLTGDNRLLTIKSTMDGLASIAFTSTYGVGVGFSSLMVLLYQGGLSLFAGGLAQSLPNPDQAPSVMLVTGVGGLMILGIALNLLEVARIRVASFLPSLLLAPVLFAIADWLS